MIRVLVADDHAVVRRGVVQILDEAPDLVAAGEASSGRQVLQKVQENDYDVLVLDIATFVAAISVSQIGSAMLNNIPLSLIHI